MTDSKTGACVTIAKGVVGESGTTEVLPHKVDAKISKLMILRNVNSDLCGSHAGVAFLIVNGQPVAHGNITDAGQSIQTEVQPGDNVVGVVHAIELMNEIACVRLGELYVELDECDFAT